MIITAKSLKSLIRTLVTEAMMDTHTSVPENIFTYGDDFLWEEDHAIAGLKNGLGCLEFPEYFTLKGRTKDDIEFKLQRFASYSDQPDGSDAEEVAVYRPISGKNTRFEIRVFDDTEDEI